MNGMINPATIEGLFNDHPDSYWLIADILNVEWRKGCLTTAGCAEPRFQVTKMNTANNEANLISWPVTLKLAEETSRSFISHWTSRSVSDIIVKCEVAGLDPTYGFPRICDSTPSKRIFVDEDSYLEYPRKQHSRNGKLVVEVKGKCFNATLALQKYDRCPTCMDHRSIAVVEQYSDSELNEDFFHRFNGNNQFLYAIVILSAITVILTTGFACLLIAFLHQKHQLNIFKSKKLLRPEPPNISRPLRASDDDSSYDTPWEQVPTVCRQSLYRGFQNVNGLTPISSSLISPIADVMALPQTDYRKTSPSSSFGTGLHDSGLESV